MEIGQFRGFEFADVFLDEFDLVLEWRIGETIDGAIEGVDGHGSVLETDEILFETDVVTDTTGKQGVVFDTGNIGNGVSAVGPSPDTAFRERRLVDSNEVGVHFLYLWRVVYAVTGIFYYFLESDNKIYTLSEAI